MQIERGSKSSLDTYQECPWKYFLKYICRISEPSGKAAVIGTMVHKVLEILSKAKKTGHYLLNDKYTDISYLCKIVFEKESKNNPHIEFAPKDFTDMVKLTESIMRTLYNPLKMETLATEKGFEITIQKTGFKYKFTDPVTNDYKEGYFMINGFIDLVADLGDCVEIIDYKTGQRKDWITGDVKDAENLSKDLQLQMYDLACKYMYPDKNRMLTIFYLKDGGPFTPVMSENNEDIVLDKIRRIFKSILNDDDPKRLIDDKSKSESHFKCHKVCYFGRTKVDGKSLCETYYNVYKDKGMKESIIELSKVTVNGNKQKSRSKNNIFKTVITD